MPVLTHLPSPHIEACEKTFVEDSEIDCELARRQHREYRSTLEKLGLEVVCLDGNLEFPDCAFVEDCAIVLPEVAIITSMGTESRRGEQRLIASELRRLHSDVRAVELPAEVEGGDVLQVGKRLLIGLSKRTNQTGIRAVEEVVSPFGYSVTPVRVTGCLHLKTGCTALPDGHLLINPEWIDTDMLPLPWTAVPDDEPWSANMLLVKETVLVSRQYPRATNWVQSRGFKTESLDISEFGKAEAGLTCLSLFV